MLNELTDLVRKGDLVFPLLLTLPFSAHEEALARATHVVNKHKIVMDMDPNATFPDPAQEALAAYKADRAAA